MKLSKHTAVSRLQKAQPSRVTAFQLSSEEDPAKQRKLLKDISNDLSRKTRKNGAITVVFIED